MQTAHHARIRLGALGLGLSALLLMVFPLARPFFRMDIFAPEETMAAASPAFASVAWMLSHYLVLPAFGVEAFTMPAIGRLHLDGVTGLAPMIPLTYRGPMTIVLILGLVFLGMGAFNFAFAIRRRGQLPVWAGFVFAIGLALWLPLLPKPVRIIDGLLIGLGGIPLAWSMWRNAAQARSFLSASTVCAGSGRRV